MNTKHIAIILSIIVSGIIIIVLAHESRSVITIPNLSPVGTPATDICFYRSNRLSSDAYDHAWVQMTITGNNVIGEFQDFSAEKGSKGGTFLGTVTSLDQDLKQIATLTWDVKSEGEQNKEELLIVFGNKAAQVAFGEMTLGANGMYLYKDKSSVEYQQKIPQVDCATLEQLIAVESYIRKNITRIVSDKAVLGGTWYVTSIMVDPQIKTALVLYEDGHIASKGLIEYTYDGSSNLVSVVSFTKTK